MLIADPVTIGPVVIPLGYRLPERTIFLICGTYRRLVNVKSHITVHEAAHEAGLSVASVSRALSSGRPVNLVALYQAGIELVEQRP